jgi:peptide/nickel transport system substrate-binding protein
MLIANRRTHLSRWSLQLIVLASALLSAPAVSAAEPQSKPAIAMHGEPALPPDFSHFPYVNPNAPKGGRLTQGVLGTFDSLNPFIVKGLPLPQVRGYVVESLMARGYDEPFTLYGLLARSVETDDARSYVQFDLDPDARFSDGNRVRPQDVIFSWRLLRDRGRPNYRTYYTKVAKAEALSETAVRFDFVDGGDRELPLILGLMPVFAEHATDPEQFEQTSFTPALGTGPYQVTEVRPGERVVLRRNPNYWAANRAVERGMWNFDEIRFDFYRDANSHMEAFRKGLYDVRGETDPARWESAYNGPALRSGRIIKEAFTTGLPQGMSGLVFNTRRRLFADIRVRQALGLLFDFGWVNRSFYFGQFRRTQSYFEGSELSAAGREADALERELLAPFPGAVSPEVLAGTPSAGADGSGLDRNRLRRALDLLEQAGWQLSKGELREIATGAPFAFEILVASKEQERLALAFSRDVGRAGIKAGVRLADAVQYERRRDTFDFDMLQYHWGQSLSPGNEQAFYWGSEAADAIGTRNYMGVKSPAVDAMIQALLVARDRRHFVAAVRALDRVLMSGSYVVPLFHLPAQWVARWSHIERPQTTSLFGYLPETWWQKPEQVQ